MNDRIIIYFSEVLNGREKVKIKFFTTALFILALSIVYGQEHIEDRFHIAIEQEGVFKPQVMPIEGNQRKKIKPLIQPLINHELIRPARPAQIRPEELDPN
uniref:Secreted protein n=1 Tax=Rhabditophanes sp. KR3021 TaxID=114890 RepID=A0AC35UDN3_9BILA